MYHYAGNNPVRYVDPDGRIIEVDESCGKIFADDVSVALEYLKQSKTGKAIIDCLVNSQTVYTIKKCNWINSEDKDLFDRNTNSIKWSSKDTFFAANGNYNSPAICLFHELVHAFDYTTKKGSELFIMFEKNNSEILLRMSGKNHEEFATALEFQVAKELNEPEGRKYYDDLLWSNGSSINIKVLGPLVNSNSGGEE